MRRGFGPGRRVLPGRQAGRGRAPPGGITASVAADTEAAESHLARASRTGAASPYIAATGDTRAETRRGNQVRPAPFLVQTKVAEKRGKSYLVLDVSSRTGADATLVIKQWICRGPATPGALTNAAKPTVPPGSAGPASPSGAPESAEPPPSIGDLVIDGVLPGDAGLEAEVAALSAK